MRIALICDGGRIARWQYRALQAAGVTHVDLLLDCRNTQSARSLVRHGAYYALNLLAIRSAETGWIDLATSDIAIGERIAFDAETEGAWQSLPAAVIDRLRAVAPEAIVKFGMGLLRVPPRDVLPAPILSYHHGDPAAFRGRPAGFWELATRAPRLGQIVQVLGNKLDGGAVVAAGETKAYPHSYRATMIEAYRHSALLLPVALRNVAAGRTLPHGPLGKNYRLPSNLAVAGMVARMASAFVARLGYGALFEKKWRVAVAPRPADPIALGGTVRALGGRDLPLPPGYSFLADPFLLPTGADALVEGLHARSGLGHILRIDGDGRVTTLLAGPGHASYPATVSDGGRTLMLPETARWSAPGLRSPDAPGDAEPLAIEGDPRLLDATPFASDGHHYLFANDRAVGAHALMLWVADSLRGPYRPHPASPIAITPRGGRMGGGIVEHAGRRFRLGQDGSRGYGAGLVVFEITALTPTDYGEQPVGEIAFADARGPHTLNLNATHVTYDYYAERFAPGAGLRRLLAKLR